MLLLQVRQPNMTLGKFCGTDIPAMISSTQNRLMIQFFTDGSVAQNGFRLEWTTYGSLILTMLFLCIMNYELFL